MEWMTSLKDESAFWVSDSQVSFEFFSLKSFSFDFFLLRNSEKTAKTIIQKPENSSKSPKKPINKTVSSPFAKPPSFQQDQITNPLNQNEEIGCKYFIQTLHYEFKMSQCPFVSNSKSISPLSYNAFQKISQGNRKNAPKWNF